MDTIYTIKKELIWTKYILQKLASLNKTFTLKSRLGGQNIYYKKWLRCIK